MKTQKNSHFPPQFLLVTVMMTYLLVKKPPKIWGDGGVSIDMSCGSLRYLLQG